MHLRHRAGTALVVSDLSSVDAFTHVIQAFEQVDDWRCHAQRPVASTNVGFLASLAGLDVAEKTWPRR